jgi:hypothetical protein
MKHFDRLNRRTVARAGVILPESLARRAYQNLIDFHEAGKGGRFAAWEHPQLFSEELRAAFRSLRQAR